MRPPLSSSKRAFVAAISGAAPEKHARIELKSACLACTFGWLSNAMNNAGTALNRVGFTRSIVCSRSSRSRGLGTSAIGVRLTSEWL